VGEHNAGSTCLLGEPDPDACTSTVPKANVSTPASSVDSAPSRHAQFTSLLAVRPRYFFVRIVAIGFGRGLVQHDDGVAALVDEAGEASMSQRAEQSALDVGPFLCH
jgi:hypothetical protein